MMKRRPVLELKDAVALVMKDLAAHYAAAGEDGVENALKKVLTKKELEHIKGKYFKNGTLYVRVDSSAWLYRLSLEKHVLLEKLKTLIKELKDIRVSLGDTT